MLRGERRGCLDGSELLARHVDRTTEVIGDAHLTAEWRIIADVELRATVAGSVAESRHVTIDWCIGGNEHGIPSLVGTTSGGSSILVIEARMLLV